MARWIFVAVDFLRRVINTGDSSIDEFLFRKQWLKDDFPILSVKTMKVFSLYFLFTSDLDTIKHPQIGHMEKALNPIELAALNWVNAEINLCK